MPIDWRNEVSTCVQKKHLIKKALRTHQSLVVWYASMQHYLKIAVEMMVQE